MNKTNKFEMLIIMIDSKYFLPFVVANIMFELMLCV
jgi:hypothetical protein